MAAPEQGSGGGLSTAIPRRYRREVAAASRASGVPLKVVAAQIDDESGWDPNVTSPAGAEGIAQFEPGTWQSWGHGSPFNPSDAFPAYGRFMGSLVRQYHGNLRDALAAYNAGPGALAAGYGYADRILSAAGEGPGARGTNPVPYRNPLRGVQGLQAERIDMGVDYSGTGPVYALGPGVITGVSNSWAGSPGVGPGTYIAERLSSGPLAGRQVYLAEHVTPRVRTGQRVTADTVIGDMFGGIETGLAAPGSLGAGGNTLAMSLNQQAPGSDPGAWPSAAGVAYSDLLHAVGAPPGAGPTKGGHGSTSGGWPPAWLTGILAGLDKGLTGSNSGGPNISGLGGVASAIGSIGQTLGDFENAISWFFVPNHWVRIFCGLAGTIFLFDGLFLMARTGRPYSVSVPGLGPVPATGGEIAPAMGIGAVTIGAILLFIAFHNLPANVTDVPSLMSHLKAEVQSGGQAAT